MIDWYNIFTFCLGSILLYLICKLVWKLINYITFRIVINKLVDLTFEIIESSKTGNNDSRKADKNEEIKSKNKEREIRKKMEKGIDVNVQIEEEEIDNLKKKEKTNDKKIIGIVGINEKYKIYGKFTQKLLGTMVKKLQHLDINDLKDKGYHQAMLEAERRSQGGRYFNSSR